MLVVFCNQWPVKWHTLKEKVICILFRFNVQKTFCKNCEIHRKPNLMTLSVKNVHQNFKSCHISVENFVIPGLFPSSTIDEIIGKMGQIFQEDSRIKFSLFVISEE